MSETTKKHKFQIELSLPSGISPEVMSRLILIELISMPGRYSREDSMYSLDRGSVKVTVVKPRERK